MGATLAEFETQPSQRPPSPPPRRQQSSLGMVQRFELVDKQSLALDHGRSPTAHDDAERELTGATFGSRTDDNHRLRR